MQHACTGDCDLARKRSVGVEVMPAASLQPCIFLRLPATLLGLSRLKSLPQGEERDTWGGMASAEREGY